LPETSYFIVEQLQKVGIDAQSDIADFAAWGDKVNTRGDFDMAIAGGIHGPEPANFADFVATGGVRNAMGYSNPRVNELFARGKLTVDVAARGPIYKEIQTIIAQDLPRLSLLTYVYPRVWRKGWTGMYWQPGIREKVPEHFFGLVKFQQ